ncbi:MAG: hypothetical protein HYV23_02795 [Deltaproteobacteria bacterium]|nr:hypothetical protein [Deltaproteobacteria bacterium]
MSTSGSISSLAFTVLLAAAAGLSGCGGSGGGSSSSSSGGTATSLEIASQVSVVDTSSDSEVRALNIGTKALKAINTSSLPSNSDYNKDTTQVYVEERSAGAFDIVNEILCSLEQSKYGDMLNGGDYKAQIDQAQCSSGKDDASEAGQSSQNQSSGSSQPDYEFWTRT